MERVILGLSDGVDSAVAALLLKNKGYEVIGIHLVMVDDNGVEAAEKSAKELGIPFEAVDIRKDLQEKVCEHFIDEYLRGRTPSPCPGCNRNVKLPALMEAAKRYGTDRIATGHYVKKINNRLYMGDAECDQSYMLAKIMPEQLSCLMLPLGEYRKSEIRKLAAEHNLSCASKPDSRENCFIKGMNYSQYIETERKNDLPGHGNVCFGNNIVGEHTGIYNYTVGQRWKDDIDGRRVYVSKIDRLTNTIELSLWENLFTRRVYVSNTTWVSGACPSEEFVGNIRVRHTRWETPECHIACLGKNLIVDTYSDLRAPAPGQMAAIYIGTELVGGGDVETEMSPK